MFLVFWPEECTKKFRGRRKFGPKKLKIKLFTKAKLSLSILYLILYGAFASERRLVIFILFLKANHVFCASIGF